jgi:hypothetical protein
MTGRSFLTANLSEKRDPSTPLLRLPESVIFVMSFYWYGTTTSHYSSGGCPLKLPDSDRHFSHRVNYATYLARRLRQAGFSDLESQVLQGRAEQLSLGRTWEDAALPVQEASADRDAQDDNLDSITQAIRLQLASRSVDAMRTEPYTLIFPQGAEYYLQANLEQQTARYGELKLRLSTYLPTDDPLQAQVPALSTALDAWTSAAATLDEVRGRQSMARDNLEAGITSWEKSLEQVYGTLVAQLGKKRAEGFFPKQNR